MNGQSKLSRWLSMLVPSLTIAMACLSGMLGLIFRVCQPFWLIRTLRAHLGGLQDALAQ